MLPSSNNTVWTPPPLVQRRPSSILPPPVVEGLPGKPFMGDGVPSAETRAVLPPPTLLTPPPKVMSPWDVLEAAVGKVASVYDNPEPGTRDIGFVDKVRAAIYATGSQIVKDPRNAAASWLQGFAEGSVIPDRLAPRPDGQMNDMERMIVESSGGIPNEGSTNPYLKGAGYLAGGLLEGEVGVVGFLATMSKLARSANAAVAARASSVLNKLGQGTDASLAHKVTGGVALGVGADVVGRGVEVATGDRTASEAAAMLRPAVVGGGVIAALANAPRATSLAGKAALSIVPETLKEFGSGFATALKYEPKMAQYPAATPGLTLADVFRGHAAHTGASIARAIDRAGVVLEPILQNVGSRDIKGPMSPRGWKKHENYEAFKTLVSAWTRVEKAHLHNDMDELREATDAFDALRAKFHSTPMPDSYAATTQDVFNVPMEYKNRNDVAVWQAFKRYQELMLEVEEERKSLGLMTDARLFWRRADSLPNKIDDFETWTTKRLAMHYSEVGNQELVGRVIDAQGVGIDYLSKGARSHTGEPLVLLDRQKLPRHVSRAVDSLYGPGAVDRIALPESVAERLGGSKSLKESEWWKLLANDPTNWWKGSLIFWGGSALQTVQMIGDMAAGVRSFPGLFLNPENWKHFGDAAKLISKRYRVPLWRSYEKIDPAAANSTVPEAHRANDAMWEAANLARNNQESTAVDMVRWGAGSAAGDAILGERDPEDLAATAALGAGAGYGRSVFRHLSPMARMQQPSGWKQGSAPHLSPWDKVAHQEYFRLSEGGLTDAGWFGQERWSMGSSALRRLYQGQAADVSAPRRVWDSVATLVSGRVIGSPLSQAADFVDGWSTVIRERENFLRLASYYYLKTKNPSIDDALAIKRVSEAYVDYGKFSDFENKFVRGFLAPFYSFYRHSVPNWARTFAGRDVGGMGLQATGAAAGMLAFESIVQLWNEQFDEEDTIGLNQKRDFHIWLGLPPSLGGDGALRGDDGNPMMLRAKLPTEHLFELLGLEGAGAITAHLFGDGIPGDDSLIARAHRIEDFDAASEIAKAPFHGTARYFKNLLHPALTGGHDLITGEQLAFGSPVLNEYSETPEGLQYLDYTAKRVFQMYAAGRELYNETHQKFGEDGKRTYTGFDFYTSRFGLGLPIERVDMNRALNYRLLDAMRLAERDGKAYSKKERRLLDVIHQQQDLEVFDRDAFARASKIAQEEGKDAHEVEWLMRFYTGEASRRSRVAKQWDAMDFGARERFLRTASEADRGALFVLLNGGKVFPDPQAAPQTTPQPTPQRATAPSIPNPASAMMPPAAPAAPTMLPPTVVQPPAPPPTLPAAVVQPPPQPPTLPAVKANAPERAPAPKSFGMGRTYEKNGYLVYDSPNRTSDGKVPTHRVDMLPPKVQSGKMTVEEWESEVLAKPKTAFKEAAFTTERRIDALDPRTAHSIQGLMGAARRAGVKLSVRETRRPQERQEWLFQQGRSRPGAPVTWTLTSNHADGNAVDFHVEGGNYKWLWENAPKFGLQTMGKDDPGHVFRLP